MKILICSQFSDYESAKEFLYLSDFILGCELVIQEHSATWKSEIIQKFEDSDLIIFYLSKDWDLKPNLIWEIEESKKYSLKRLAILENDNVKRPEFHFITKDSKANDYISNFLEQRKALYTEQYKILISSSEKVTEQRMKVNNLFMTIIISVISIPLIAKEKFEFNSWTMLAMLSFSLLGLLVTFYWHKLINSYGTLNTGKFQIISILENKLSSQVFDKEWEILTKKLKYESNTDTEKSIIKDVRGVIIIMIIVEAIVFGVTCYQKGIF